MKEQLNLVDSCSSKNSVVEKYYGKRLMEEERGRLFDVNETRRRKREASAGCLTRVKAH